MTITIRTLTGSEILSAIDDLARLRMTVFAGWPYLYDGDAAYERDYLREFVAARDSLLVAACDGERIVGAATASPMAEQKAEFRKPFEDRGIDTASLFYSARACCSNPIAEEASATPSSTTAKRRRAAAAPLPRLSPP